MNVDQLVYSVFGVVLVGALILDLGILSKSNKVITTSSALAQTIFWVLLALGFGAFMWFEEGSKTGLEYVSGYLMEWSLSIDNIFVFVMIFNAFQVKEKYYGRVLLIGILMAILFRVIFITVGVELVERFSQLLYVFGLFLLYTGVKMFTAKDDHDMDPQKNKVYKFLKRFLPIVPNDGNGKFIIRPNRKPQYTMLFVVVVLLATIDLVFALDSIPAVMGISTNKLVIYTSNIFAVLGLRSLFFLLRNAVDKFAYLKHGIAIVLVFIGLKMLLEHFINEWFTKTQQTVISLGVIIVCVTVSMLVSAFYPPKQHKHKHE